MLFVKSLKETLVVALGGVGFVIWFLLGAVLLFLPLSFLNLPLWIDFIIILILMNTQFIGGVLSIILWVWSFTVVIAQPIDGWSVFYFIGFAIYFFTSILPTVTGIISGIIELLNNRN